MNANRHSLARMITRNRVGRWVTDTTLFEVVTEAVNTRLPLSYRVMRLACRSNYLRDYATRRYSCLEHPPITTTSETVFGGLNVSNTVSELNNKGFVAGLELPAPYVKTIRTFCAKTVFVTDSSTESISIDLADDRLPRPGQLVYRCNDPHKNCETIDQLSRDRALVGVARGYLRTEPLLRSTRLFWSYPDVGDGYNPLYGFHYDIDDYKFLKLFFYLNDVDLEGGPHVIIEGTQKGKNWFEKTHRRLTDEQAKGRYQDRIKVMTGRAGCGFFEDTFCYHKGAKPRKRRLMLEFEYCISDTAAARTA